MTAALFFAEPGSLTGVGVGDTVQVGGEEARHAAVVRRIGTGETVQVADGSGTVVSGPVLSASRDQVMVRADQIRQEPQPEPRFTLLQALAKGGRDEQAIEAATELGVDAVLPWQAERSIVQWRGDRAAKGRRKWESTVHAAAKQSRRPTVPTVGEYLTGAAAARRVGQATLAVVLHEDADQSLTALDLPSTGEVLLVVGPEGGISPAELGAFQAAGARTTRLGPTVLRSSSAGPTALAILLARTRW